MRRILAALGIAAVLVPLAARPAGACSCVEFPPKKYVRMAEVIFTGRAMSVDLRSTDHLIVAEFAVTRVYKGPAIQAWAVETSAESSSCGFEFVEGRRYTVFASAAGGVLHTNLCTATRFGPINAARFGLDEGVRLDPPSPGLPPGPIVVAMVLAALGVLGLVAARGRLRR